MSCTWSFSDVKASSLPTVRRFSQVYLGVRHAPDWLLSKVRKPQRRVSVGPVQAGFKIYTRTGDAGQSSLYNGERVPKTHPILDALGHVDELNSAMGLAREYIALELDKASMPEELVFIQARLMDVGSAVATPTARSNDTLVERAQFDPTATEKLEACNRHGSMQWMLNCLH